jgi:hypothetical protein
MIGQSFSTAAAAALLAALLLRLPRVLRRRRLYSAGRW